MPEAAPVYRPFGTVSIASDRPRPSPSRTYGHRWRKLRTLKLQKDPLCQCDANLGRGCGYPATVVDHRRPHNGDPGLMYAWDNLQSMTKACHDRKTAARDGGFGNPIRKW
jgi:5-methylcytosine-specific restriction enzyme A